MTPEEIAIRSRRSPPTAPPASRRWWSMSKASRARSICCCAGAPAEGRPRENLDPGAGRPVSRLHRGGAQAAARACRRLPRDGGLARLSEIAPAAARRARAGGPERRGHGAWRWRCGSSGWKRSARWRRNCSSAPQLDRDVFAPRPAASRSPTSSIRNGRRRSTICSRPMRSSASRHALARVRLRQADGVVARRGARGARAPDRPVARLDAARRIPDLLCGRAGACARP